MDEYAQYIAFGLSAASVLLGLFINNRNNRQIDNHQIVQSVKFKSLDNNIDNIANMVNSLHEKLTTKLKSNSTKNQVNDIENNLLNDLKVEIQRIPLV